jgi:hypothetical protein
VNLTAPILSFSGPNLHAHVTSGPGAIVNGSDGGNQRNTGVLRTGTAASTGHVPAALTQKILNAQKTQMINSSRVGPGHGAVGSGTGQLSGTLNSPKGGALGQGGGQNAHS